MAKRRRALGLALMGWGLAWASPPAPACRVVGSTDPPFRVFGADGQVSGLYFDLLEAAARRAGWPLSFQEVPPARALDMMKNSEADLMVGLLRTAERESYLRFSRIALPPENKAVYTRGQKVMALADLRGLRVGLHRGKRYGLVFDSLTDVQRVWVRDYEAALQMLNLGRIDAVVIPERQGDLLIPQLGLTNLVKQPLHLKGEIPHLAVARGSPWAARLPELERGFDSLRKDGSWDRALASSPLKPTATPP